MYTFNLATTGTTLAISRVRDEIDDVTAVAGGGVEGKDHFLSDARIESRLAGAVLVVSGEWPVVWQAAATCLDTLATNQAFVLKVKTTMGEQVDGESVAKAIREHARALEKRAREGVTVATVEPVVVAAPVPGTVRMETVF